jgi:hypothetical protein
MKAAAKAHPADALERLRDDHHQINELLGTLQRYVDEDGSAVSDARRVAGLIGTLLRVHDEIESSLLMPALTDAFGSDPVLRRSQAAAQRVSEAFDRVEAMSPTDLDYGRAVHDLARVVSHRFAQDEEELFDLARGAPLDWAALDREMGVRQEALLSAGSGLQ